MRSPINTANGHILRPHFTVFTQTVESTSVNSNLQGK